MVTTIQVDEHVKDKLDKLKEHYRETYNELLQKMIASYKFENKANNVDSLKETVEIMSEPELMKSIARGIEDYNKQRFKTLAQVRKEMG